ncbi:MAG: DUF6159 family protein [Chloroflexota bacterium]
MGRISRSWELVKASWSVLRADKELLLFPIVSTIVTLIVVAIFAIPFLATDAIGRYSNGGSLSIMDLVLLFLFYVVTSMVVIFCNAALVGAANIRLNGGDPTVRDGFRIAWSHIGSILGWAVITATVGMVLRALRERGGIVGTIAAAIGGVAWGLITFLVVPILVIEGLGPVDAIKKSGDLLRRTWGEQIVGNASIGLVFGLISVVVGVVGFGLSALLGAGAWPLGVGLGAITLAIILAIALLGGTLSGIFTVALYRYATTGQPGGTFPVEVMDSAFRAK